MKKMLFFIHVDKKVDIQLYSSLFNMRNVVFVKERVDVRWGHITQIEAYLNTFKYCIDDSYDRIFLLSGDTLPLHNLEYLSKYCEENADKEFVSCKICLDAYIDRIRYDNSFWYSSNIIKRIFGKIRNTLGFKILNPKFDKLPQLYFGSNWIGITQQCLSYLIKYVNNNPDFYDAFKNSVCGDELFFQTIIMNSSFSKSIIPSGIMFVDWTDKGSHPRILQNEDFDELLNISRSYLFARKFSISLDFQKYEDKFLRH